MLIQGLFEFTDDLASTIDDRFKTFVVAVVNNHIPLAPRSRGSMIIIPDNLLASDFLCASPRWVLKFRLSCSLMAGTSSDTKISIGAGSSFGGFSDFMPVIPLLNRCTRTSGIELTLLAAIVG